ncbi:cyclic nucleotide-binding domain-containing protein [Cerasicoccus maritimus]|uniref:cyclic nucleotide-binding domain-containing protein n=1 Tax=Cerasicoccus maritimus TaxID=490089 RepID=UPI002852C91A|nr:cyclic nucleotide-binding domain-containing protein [Cerasicoccus maritimus]
MTNTNAIEGGAELLRRHALFHKINDAALERFLNVLKVEKYQSGDAIIREGETGNRLYMISSGRVVIEKKVFNKEAITSERIAVLQKGETFGEMELVDTQPRSATVRALEDTTCLSLSSEDLHYATEDDVMTFSQVVMNLAREISLRLRNTDVWLAGSLFSIRQRD